MTQGELCQRMTSRELSEHIAYTRWFAALPDAWRQTSLLAAALLAPHCEKGKRPKPDVFNPIDTPPQHESQDFAALMQLRRSFGLGDLELSDDG
jgi:hypothetical protein